MATIIHLGDHETDCDVCKLNCGCDKCEQDSRILENIKLDIEYALETGNLQMFEDMFEDRDPFEFI